MKWEVERDRFGVSFSGPLEVGEVREVVPAELQTALIRVRDSSYKGDYYTEDLWEIANDALEAVGITDPRFSNDKSDPAKDRPLSKGDS